MLLESLEVMPRNGLLPYMYIYGPLRSESGRLNRWSILRDFMPGLDHCPIMSHTQINYTLRHARVNGCFDATYELNFNVGCHRRIAFVLVQKF